MTTDKQFLRQHQETYKAFIHWSAISGIGIIVVLILLAIFRT